MKDHPKKIRWEVAQYVRTPKPIKPVDVGDTDSIPGIDNATPEHRGDLFVAVGIALGATASACRWMLRSILPKTTGEARRAVIGGSFIGICFVLTGAAYGLEQVFFEMARMK